MASYDDRDQAGESVVNTVSSAGEGTRRQVLLGLILSAIAVALAVVHLIWPGLKVDAVTIALFVVAAIPWLAPILSSLEGPGGWKLEFREVQRSVKEQQRHVVDLSNRMDKVERIAFSGNISKQAQAKL